MGRRRRYSAKPASASPGLDRKFALVLAASSAVLIALAAFVVVSLQRRGDPAAAAASQHGPSPARDVGADGGAVRIPAAALPPGRAAFFRYAPPHGRAVRFIVFRDPDGRYRGTFDACGKCRQERGYREDGDALVCNYCDRRFPLGGLDGRDRCEPLPLPVRLQEDELVVRVDDLNAAAGAATAGR